MKQLETSLRRIDFVSAHWVGNLDRAIFKPHSDVQSQCARLEVTIGQVLDTLSGQM